jgi:peptidoglycan hydrolase-like protein with peptidoglycan-binding domain
MTVVGGVSAVSAYTTEGGVTNDRNTYTPPKGRGESCLELKNVNLRFGMSDRVNNQDILSLQSFLASRSLLNAQPSGYYGSGTVAAVTQFQRENGLTPTGVTGPLTRAKIKEQTCTSVYGGGQGDDAVEVNPLNTYRPPKSAPVVDCSSQENVVDGKCQDTFKVIGRPLPISRPIACTMEARFCPDGTMMSRTDTCEWLPCRGSSTEVSSRGINPSNTWPPIKIRPVACTMEARYCPDGTMMSRTDTCEWLPCRGSSTEVSSTAINPSNTWPPIKNGPLCNSEQYIKDGKCVDITYTCPNGKIIKGYPRQNACGTDLQSGSPSSNPIDPVMNNLYICEDGIVSHTPCKERVNSATKSFIQPQTNNNNFGWPKGDPYPTGTKVNFSPVPAQENPIKGGVMACLDVMRFCPDGSPMPRGVEACSWKPEECKGGNGTTGFSQDRVSSSVPTSGSDTKSIRAQSEAKRLEQLMQRSYITDEQRVMLQKQRSALLNSSDMR